MMKTESQMRLPLVEIHPNKLNRAEGKKQTVKEQSFAKKKTEIEGIHCAAVEEFDMETQIERIVRKKLLLPMGERAIEQKIKAATKHMPLHAKKAFQEDMFVFSVSPSSTLPSNNKKGSNARLNNENSSLVGNM